jgi:oligopeptidase B
MARAIMTLMCSLQWEEWGNPNQEDYYHYMKSYAPVDNIVAGRKYPNILATGGLHDPRVACARRSPIQCRCRAVLTTVSCP